VSVWFARVGLPLSPEERAAVDALLDAIAPRPSRDVALPASWPEAMRFVRAAEFDATWWDEEEEERERLWARVADLESESALSQRIAALQAGLETPLRAAAAAACRAGVAGPDAVREATGSALLSAQQNALAEMAGQAPGHRFRRKFALFERGRWPLGYHAARFVIF
jgi:hypothetical protein